MKFTSFALIAMASPMISGFAPTVSNIGSPSNRQTTRATSLSMNIPSIVGAGIISFGVATFAGEPSIAYSPPSVVIANVPSIEEVKAIAASDNVGEIIKEEKILKEDVKIAEKIAKKDAKAAKLERKREAFFEYDAKRAAEEEARIEATEQKFAEEARKEEEEVLRLKEEIKKDEELAAKATNKAEKLKILREERKIAAREKALERKEKRAEKLEKVFLAEEEQEKKILEKKTQAARAEEARFEKVEAEYEKAEAEFEEERAELDIIEDAESKLGLKGKNVGKKR